MNRAELEDFVADVRQFQLTRRLGQVECFGDHDSDCWLCGAAV